MDIRHFATADQYNKAVFLASSRIYGQNLIQFGKFSRYGFYHYSIILRMEAVPRDKYCGKTDCAGIRTIRRERLHAQAITVNCNAMPPR